MAYRAPQPTPQTIRALRVQRGWSTDELASHLGMHGSGSIVSEWEEGQRPFEGPIASLLLSVLATGGAGSLHERAEGIWRRETTTWRESWRQVSVTPAEPTSIDPLELQRLFPGAEIPHAQHVHGFPFVDHNLPGDVFGFRDGAWRGVIPQRDHPPAYLWMLEQNGAFLYREQLWEDDRASVTGGHIHVGWLLAICAATVYFVRRLAERVPLSPSQEIALVLNGMKGRGIVAQREWAPSDTLAVDEARAISSEDRIEASITLSLESLRSSPLAVVFQLVGQAVGELRPDLADRARLERQLRLHHAFDSRRSGIRFVGFLDDVLGGRPPRRAVVSMSGRRVGLLVETLWGSRFTYDRVYVEQPGARPLSPAMPVRSEPYEGAGLLPFFENLLPEGAQLEILVRRRELDPSDKLGLLLATLPASIGDVQIHQEERLETP